MAGIKNGIVIPTSPWKTRAPAGAILRREPDSSRWTIQAAELILLYAADRLRSFNSSDFIDTQHLTLREREVLQWTARGKTAWEIGEILHISEGVVRNYIARAMSKLNAVSKAQAVARAIRSGEIDY
ncbi:MAG: helix-turn-helix domain-containing protein [Xanthobacteraceae bacterium]